MRVLIFEWLNGGGLWFDDSEPFNGCPTVRQGRDMLLAVADDFSAANHEVITLSDARLDVEFRVNYEVVTVESSKLLPKRLHSAGEASDAILLIAPETDGCLLRALDWMRPFQNKIVSPDRAFVALTSDKTSTSEHLKEHNIPVPNGFKLSSASLSATPICPCVIKPNSGAGSEQVRYFQDSSQFEWPSSNQTYRVEQFIAGQSVSVSVIAHQDKVEILPPTGQCFDDHPIGHYVRATHPLPADIAYRATRLAHRCVDALPKTRGYFGIDMIIAEMGPDEDCVIEVNPRLTASYAHLRNIVPQNLAQSMLKSLTTQCQGGHLQGRFT